MRRRVPVLAALAVLGLLALAALVAGVGRSGGEAGGTATAALNAACPDNQVSASPFVDVAPGDPAELAISCLADYGVVQGARGSSYAPGGVVPHEELAQLVDRLGRLADADPDGDRDDVDPAAPVTRAELAASLHRLAERAGAEGFEPTADAYDDDEELPQERRIDALAAAGVTTAGASARFFDPREPVTREVLTLFAARTLDVLVAQGVVDSRYRDDIAPVRVTLDQAGRLIEPGAPLSGEVTGDRIATTAVRSPCVTGVVEDAADTPGVQFSVASDRQAPIGRCPVTVAVTFDNGRTRAEPLFVVLPGFTALPELVHVERVASSTDRGHATSDVRFLFDAPAQLVPESDPSRIRFTLTTYDVQGSHIATSVRQDGDQAVIATFGTRERPVGPAELRQVSYATAFTGAMVDPAGRATPAGTAQLNPRELSSQAYPGPTWTADLLSVSRVRPDPRRPAAALVDFLFDSPLEAGEPPNERVYAFDVVLADGSGRRCTTADPLPQQRITVSCDRLSPTSAPVSRGVVSAPGFGSDDPLAGSLLTRRPTANPDVVGFAWGPAADQATFVFDEPVDVGTADRFLVQGPYAPTGGFGQLAQVSATDPTRVVVTIQGVDLQRSTVATARGAAVFSRATGRENLYEQALVPVREVEQLLAGRTLLPDLVAVRTSADGVARYEYDSGLLTSDAGFRPVEDLRLYLADGTQLACREAQLERDPNAPATAVTCRDFGVEAVDGPTATAAQVGAATYATASYGTPPAARVVEGAQR